MENLNAEQVKKALEWCASINNRCEECPIDDKKKDDCECGTFLAQNALALINSQEQRIKELTEELTCKETEYNELYELCESYRIERDAMRGAANSYKMYIKTIEKENETLKTLLDESFEAQNTVKADTVRKMQEMVYEFADDLNTIDAYIIKEMIDQIVKEMLGGEK